MPATESGEGFSLTRFSHNVFYLVIKELFSSKPKYQMMGYNLGTADCQKVVKRIPYEYGLLTGPSGLKNYPEYV